MRPAFRCVPALLLVLIGPVLWIAPLHAAPGDPDTSFDLDGLVTTSFLGDSDYAYDLAIQPDGKIVVVGEVSLPTDTDIAIARYLPGGGLDSSFDGDGKLTLSLGSQAEFALGVVLQPDGKIVIAGGVDTVAGTDVFVARFNTDGSLDTTFNDDGVFTATPAANSVAENVALQPDGKIVIGGLASGNILAMRLNPDGTPDTTFDDDGIVLTAIGASATGTAIALQEDGKILVAGYSAGATNDFALVRYETDGDLDPSFDGDGIVTTPIGAASDYATGVVVQPDGKILLHGFSAVGLVNNFALARYNPDGDLDSTFDGDGKILIPFGSGVDEGRGLALQADGKILAFGNAHVGGGNEDLVLARLNPDGSFDTGFGGGDGFVTTEAGATNDQGSAIALQADGKIVAAGYNADDFVVVRYLGDSGDLSMTKTASVSEAEVGDTVTYTLTVKNNGASSLGGVTVTDALDSKLTLQSSSPGVGTCSGTATVTCDLGTLAAGAEVTVTLVVKPNAAGTIANQATVAAQAVETNATDNTSASVSLTVTGTTGGSGGSGGCSLSR